MNVTKQIIDRATFRPQALKAMRDMASIVRRTLGPGGDPILLARVGQALDGSPIGPRVTKDGVSVADECSSEDALQAEVMKAIKDICKKTNVIAGDGTTTAIVLGEALLNETIRVLDDNSSLNPQLVKESIELALKDVLKRLKAMAIPVKDMETIKEVATISANGDSEIGSVISQAFEHVGAEGVVTVDESGGQNMTLTLVEGYQFGRGAQARQAFFNNKDLTQFEEEQTAVLMYDGRIMHYTDLIPAIEAIAITQKTATGESRPTLPPMLIIANEFSAEVLTWLMIQKAEGGWKICAVEGPHMTHVRSGYLEDLAVYTGGSKLGNGGKNLKAVEREDWGLVDRVIIDKYRTTLYGGQGAEDEVLARVDQLNALKLQAESPYDAQILNDRLAAITNGIAKIGVGGITELEIKEKYDRVEDALNAARAAIQEGVVPGGGTALLRIADQLRPKTIGHLILKVALRSPFTQILDNIGLSNEAVAQAEKEILGSRKKVYDARTKSVRNAFSSGIVDPVKVTKSALENAVSIATLLSTSGGAIIYAPVK